MSRERRVPPSEPWIVLAVAIVIVVFGIVVPWLILEVF